MNTFREKVIDVIEKIKGSKKLSLLAILLLVAAVPLTVFIAQQVQDIRQQANTNQATITVTPNTIAAGGTVTVNWTIAQPTTAPTATPVPATPTLSPTPSPVGCPMYSRGTPTLSGKTQTITLTPAANNPFQRIQFTSITNATVTIGNQTNQTTPFTYEIPETEGLSPITFSLTKVTSEQAATVQLNVIDACGPKADTYGLGASVGNSAYNLPSLEFVKKAYAQIAITGAETLQLFKVTDNASTTIGAKRYLNCQAIGDATNPVPPSSPMYTDSCSRILIPADAQPGSYIFRMLATDGTTVIGESNVFTVTAPGGGNGDLKSGLISYWSMNRDAATSTVAIDELSRNNGTILANTLTTGKVGNAHTFGNGTATDFIDIPNNISLAPENFTVSAWIFPTDANSLGRGDNSSIFNRRDIANTRGMNFEIEGDATSPAGTMHCDVVIKNANGTFNSNRAKNTAATLVLPGQWNHVACVYNGSVVKIFINGVMAGSVPLTGSMNNPDNPLTQIGRNLITNQIFKGKIDEVGYWNRGLSDAEIAQLATGISLYPPTEPTITTAVSPTPSVSLVMAPTTVTKGTPIQVQFQYPSSIQSTTTDLFSVYKEASTDPTQLVPNDQTAARVINMYASNCSATPTTTTRTSGACNIETATFTPGRYSVRLFANNGFTQRIGIVSFTVLDITSPPTPSATFSAKLFLTGIGSPSGTFAPKHPERNVRITIFDLNNNLVATREGKITYASVSGSFVGQITTPINCPPTGECTQANSTIPAGNYIVKVFTPQFLRKSVPGTVRIEPNTTTILPPLTLIPGDATVNNILNILDYNMITTCFGAKANGAPCQDLTKEFQNRFKNSNGVIDTAAYNLFLRVLPPLASFTGKEATDFNDDGIVNGIDYNLFIRSLSTKEGD